MSGQLAHPSPPPLQPSNTLLGHYRGVRRFAFFGPRSQNHDAAVALAGPCRPGLDDYIFWMVRLNDGNRQ